MHGSFTTRSGWEIKLWWQEVQGQKSLFCWAHISNPLRNCDILFISHCKVPPIFHQDTSIFLLFLGFTVCPTHDLWETHTELQQINNSFDCQKNPTGFPWLLTLHGQTPNKPLDPELFRAEGLWKSCRLRNNMFPGMGVYILAHPSSQNEPYIYYSQPLHVIHACKRKMAKHRAMFLISNSSSRYRFCKDFGRRSTQRKRWRNW